MPERLSDYVFIDEIGRNGSISVCWAHDRKSDRKVAIKAVPMPRDPAAQRCFRAQADAMASLTHPNVAQIHWVEEFERTLVIVMEFVDVVPLQVWWNYRSVAEILGAFTAVGEALAAAHAVGVVHRDFKPPNVSIHYGRVVVMDFGLTHADLAELVLPHANDELTRLTCIHGIVGTPAYMAPEQWLGAEVTALADQFSFCVVLWEALHGHRPFAGTSAAQLEQAVLSGSILELEHTAMSNSLREVLVRGLQTEPQRRFESMHALLDALAR